jgi:hypothetical protein
VAARAPHATLCTVLTPAHLELGALNRELVERLNPGEPIAWSVAFNPAVHTPPGAAHPAGAEADLKAARKRFPGAAIAPGPTLEQMSKAVLEDPAHRDIPKAERRRLTAKYLGSYHHAAGLALALKQVKTRYAVIIDPDFYVVRPDWIAETLGRMAGQDLAVFGAPWSPRWYQKYRGFPCTHLMVLDLEKVPDPAGPLKPDLLGGGRRTASGLWSRYASAKGPDRQAALRAILAHPLQAIAEDLRQRASIGSARDTGYGLMQALAARPDLRTELVDAVFSPKDGFMPAAVSGLQSAPVLEALLPDRMRYAPRRGVSRRGFADLGGPDFRARGWEEFLWRGEPFAVHVRGELQRRPGRGIDLGVLRSELSQMLERLGRGPLPATSA